MNERDLWWKIVLVGCVVALAFASVWPLNEKLKFGIDLYGGYSLLYEIDTTGLKPSDRKGLSKRVMHVLRDRVDPKGVYNLVWRPVGHNRLEIQMPRPSEELSQARQEYESLREQIQKSHLRRSQIERALTLSGADRTQAFATLTGPIAARQPLLNAAAVAYDAYQEADKTYQARVEAIEAGRLTEEQIRATVEVPAETRPDAITALSPAASPEQVALLKVAGKAWDEMQAARAATQPAPPATQPENAQRQYALTKNRYVTAVLEVVKANPDPDKLTGGVTIDTVVDLEGKFIQAVNDVLATNLDTGRLQTVLEAKPGDAFRKTKLAEITEEYPGLAGTIQSMVVEWDKLRTKRRGEGRLEDPSDLQRLLRGAGVLEYRILAEVDQANPDKYAKYIEQLKARGPRRPPGEETYQWFEIENPADFVGVKNVNRDFETSKYRRGAVCERYGDKYYVLSQIGENYTLVHKPGSADWSLKSARPDRDQNGRPCMSFTLDERGGSKFDVLTRTNLKRQLCIFLDDMAISHATIQSAIRTRGQITGSFTVREVQEMVKKLEAGSLPRKLKDPPISVRSIGPSLGEANRSAGLKAAKYAAVAVAIFVLLYYFYAGGIAVTAVAMNILFIGAMMSTLGATLTLPGIAGLVLAVGMAVDANVLINERIREELARGTAVRMAIKLGYERAFSAILDSNVTTVLTCVILYLLGSEEIKGFGLTLGIGVFINIFTAYFVTRMFFEVMVMLRVPKEVVRFPIYTAFGIAAFGAMVYGLGYWLSDEAARSQSILMLFGRAIMYCGPVILGIVALMHLFRAIHSGRERGGKSGIPMLRLIGSPKIDWFGKRYLFVALSAVLVIGGAYLFLGMESKNLYDIEFLGGTSAQIDLKEPGRLTKNQIVGRLETAGEHLKTYGKAMEQATIDGSGGVWTLRAPGVPAGRIEPIIKKVMGKSLAQGTAVAFDDPGSDTVTILTRSEAKLSEAQMQQQTAAFGSAFTDTGAAIAGAQVQSVQAFGQQAQEGRSFDIVTRETNKEIVIAAIMDTLQDDIEIQPALSFKIVHDEKKAGNPFFVVRNEKPEELGLPIPENEAKRISLEGLTGAVAILLDDIDPPQTVDELSGRLRAMRLQPGFEKFGWRDAECTGLTPESPGSDRFKRVLVTVADENYPLDEGGSPSSAWIDELAQPEVTLLQEALERQTSLQQITQFDKQVSGEAQQDALIALALSWLIIILYVWFRFGNIRWGLAAVVALIHDVIITCGAVALTYSIADTALGKALMIDHFRIDLALVAAFLTVVGYSVNDTIVVFDRIRENRGRQPDVAADIMNRSVSETLSRTLLTFLTTLLAIVIMYVFGGPGIHGFNFVLFVGLSIGTYSSIAVASQILVRRDATAKA